MRRVHLPGTGKRAKLLEKVPLLLGFSLGFSQFSSRGRRILLKHKLVIFLNLWKFESKISCSWWCNLLESSDGLLEFSNRARHRVVEFSDG